MNDNEFYPIYGATLECAEWGEQGNLVMHFRDERGYRYTLSVFKKENKMKEGIIYLAGLLIVAVGVALAVGIL